MKITGNEPALPVHPSKDPDGYGSGLTFRQEFAARAMQGLLSSGDYATGHEILCAQKAVIYADLLIDELNKSDDSNTDRQNAEITQLHHDAKQRIMELEGLLRTAYDIMVRNMEPVPDQHATSDMMHFVYNDLIHLFNEPGNDPVML